MFYLKKILKAKRHKKVENERIQSRGKKPKSWKKAGIAIIIADFKKFKVKGKQKIERQPSQTYMNLVIGHNNWHKERNR